MLVPRYGHTATLLPDGCIVIIGGLLEENGQEQLTDVVEKTCPDGGNEVAKKFWKLGRIRIARAFHTATLLDSARLLISGGRTSMNTTEGEIRSIETVHMVQ
jgi:hypothetical protein